MKGPAVSCLCLFGFLSDERLAENFLELGIVVQFLDFHKLLFGHCGLLINHLLSGTLLLNLVRAIL